MPLDLFMSDVSPHFIVGKINGKEYAFFHHELRQHLIKCDGNVAVYNKTKCLNCKQSPEHLRIVTFEYLHVGVLHATTYKSHAIFIHTHTNKQKKKTKRKRKKVVPRKYVSLFPCPNNINWFTLCCSQMELP